MKFFYPDPKQTEYLDRAFAECRRLHWKVITDAKEPFIANLNGNIIVFKTLDDKYHPVSSGQFNNQLAIENE